MNNFMKNILQFCKFIVLFIVTGCTGIPAGIEPVKNFDINKYTGTWYEIVRSDNSFEKNLIAVSAKYTPSGSGGITVLNKGFNTKKNKWQSVEGKAYFINSHTVGRLKVSFFWPFYSSYNIIELDEKDYSYAMVCGYSKSYFWILSRNKSLDKETLDKLLNKAKELGFDSSTFIFTQQLD